MSVLNFKPESGGTYEIKYEPGPTAIRAHLSPARVKFIWGPVRSGKSTFLVMRALMKAIECAKDGVPLKAVILRDTYRNLLDTTAKTLLEWLGPLGRLVNRQGVQDFLFRVPGLDQDCEILLRHGQTASDASSFLSSDYGYIAFEEVAPAFTPTGQVSPGIAEEVFDLALSRLVQTGVKNPELVLTCNPPPVTHWSYRRILTEDPAVLKDKNWWYWFFPAVENEKNLRPGYYDELRKHLAGKEHLIKRFVDGEVVTIYPGMPVFGRDFRQELHVRSDLKPIKGKPLILGWDFGLTPACVVTQVDAKGRWLWLKEFQAGYEEGQIVEQMGAKQLGEIVKAEINQSFPGLQMGLGYGDPSMNTRAESDEKTVKQALNALGFRLSPGKKDIASRIEGIRGRLTSMIDGEPALLISRHGCPFLIEALGGGYRYRVSRDGHTIYGLEPIKDEFSHPVDAAGYVASKLFTVNQLVQKYEPRRAPTPWAV